jgi:S-adenosylmethionine hydrolase
MRPLLTLTTDFGTGSAYVAQVKGVILSLCREVDLVDVSHAISAQNVREGAVVLADATPRFPEGTLHLAVVDPGVGTRRRILYAEIGNQRYLAPDNGLLSLLVRQHPLRSLRVVDQPQYWLPKVSPTFHGRDIFAPVAAHLLRGVAPQAIGSPADRLEVQLPWPEPQRALSRITGEVLFIDSFGNLITNIYGDELARLGDAASLTVTCGGRSIQGLITSYGAALPGEIVALLDSQGRLEIAQVGGSAARALNVEAGAEVLVRLT